MFAKLYIMTGLLLLFGLLFLSPAKADYYPHKRYYSHQYHKHYHPPRPPRRHYYHNYRY